MYKEMMETYASGAKTNSQQKDALTFVKQKIDSAKWFVDAIRQRQLTLTLTMQAIVDHQHDYFLSGDETDLRPMILKDIADVVQMDISTVSRVANSKYVQTPYGTFLLKSFLSESLTTETGEEVSSREVKKILQEAIEGEDKRKPLSDEKLGQVLNAKGYNIARRTVAKYREQLGIPVARLRKNSADVGQVDFRGVSPVGDAIGHLGLVFALDPYLQALPEVFMYMGVVVLVNTLAPAVSIWVLHRRVFE